MGRRFFRNGYDCEKTKRAIGKYRMGNQCISCLYGCNPYVEWIDNQRKQFDKQVKKYADEIKKYTKVESRSSKTRRAAGGGSDHKGYEKKFYDELKAGDYENVDAFLKLLNKEKACKEVKDDKEGKIDFEKVNSASSTSGGTNDTSGTNDKGKGTFYRSEYCQPCPDCGVKKVNNGNKWEEKHGSNVCKNINFYKPIDKDKGTPIEILKSGEGHEDIRKKIDDFCNKTSGSSVVAGGSGDCGTNIDSSLCEKWKCYEGKDVVKVKVGQDDDDDVDPNYVESAGGLCILENNDGKENVNKQKTYNDFFNFWVAHMLKDSIHWRTEKIKKCLENGTKTCGKNKCNSKCKCYERWVKQKREEWRKIVQHFKTQKGLPGGLSHYKLLELLLEKGVLLTSIKEAYGNAKELEGIKNMLKEEERKNKEEEAADGTDNENNTTIDKLLNHEAQDADKCLQKCQDPQQPPQQERGVARSATSADSPPPPRPADEEEEDEDEEDEDGEQDNQETTVNEEEEKEEKKEDATVEGGSPPASQEDGVNPCDIVAELFKETDNLTKACQQKYGGNNSRLGWKCVPTTSGDQKATPPSDSNQGGICVPPRRRKLYVGKLETLDTDSTSPSGDKTASQDPSDKLREAFIESAAIETFFLWDRYKKENTKDKTAVGVAASLLQLPKGDSGDGDSNDPEKELKDGTIPEEFKRQMFYTLADYKDILDGKNIVVGDKQMQEKEDNIKKAIEKIFQNSGEQQTSGAIPPPPSGSTQTQPSDEQRKTWWQKNGQHIWNGMICALTYKEDTSGGEGKTTITQDTTAYGKLWDEANNKPQSNGQQDYTYEKVELKEDSGGPKTGGLTNTPTLKEFISRPPYFRYLEEWGETFCKERKKRLEKIKDDCKVQENTGRRRGELKQKYSGDGEECKIEDISEKGLFAELDKPSCGKSCSSYRKWIERKKDEYDEQEKAYAEQQKKGAQGNSGIYDEKFVKKLRSDYETIDSFLNSLKKGPCKKYNESGEDEIKFDINSKTLKHTEYCKPCSSFKIDCENGKCSDDNVKKCQNNKISANDIKHEGDSTVLDMRVSDNNTTGFDDLDACREAHIFKGFRKEQWKCGEFCGVHVCALEKKDTNGEVKEHIIVKELLKRWLEYFLEDYNKINAKISRSRKKGEETKSIKGCVDEWIKLKKEEWKKIKDTYLDKYTKQNDGSNDLTNFLEQGLFYNEVQKAIKPCGSLRDFERSIHCNGTESSKKESGKDGNKSYVIDCLLDRLQEKATSCLSSPSGENLAQYDEEDLTLEEEENENTLGKQQPSFCPKVDTPKPEKGGCEEAPPPGPPATSEETNNEETLVIKTEEEAVPEPKKPTPEKKVPKPQPQPPQPDLSPLKTALMSSTIMWSVGIAFAAFTYFFLK
ncbi:hypothetical protein PFTANZ_06461, partial [Plasmodium falciparum Tanzania (2000708)]